MRASVSELVAERLGEADGSRMNEDLDALVYEFFRTFARFEYALKASGFHRPNRNAAEADWTRSQNRHQSGECSTSRLTLA